MKFRAPLQLGGKTATGIRVPDEVVDALGAGKRPPVVATINGYMYRSTIGVMDGAFMLPVSAEHREGAGIAAGDEVEVDLQVDDKPREVALPHDLAAAINSDEQAKQFFDGLSPSYKKAYVTWVESAKRAETRDARVAKVVPLLQAGKKQP